MKRVIILLCLLGLATLPSCGLFADDKDSKPNVEASQMETGDPDDPDPGRDD